MDTDTWNQRRAAGGGYAPGTSSGNNNSGYVDSQSSRGLQSPPAMLTGNETSRPQVAAPNGLAELSRDEAELKFRPTPEEYEAERALAQAQADAVRAKAAIYEKLRPKKYSADRGFILDAGQEYELAAVMLRQGMPEYLEMELVDQKVREAGVVLLHIQQVRQEAMRAWRLAHQYDHADEGIEPENAERAKDWQGVIEAERKVQEKANEVKTSRPRDAERLRYELSDLIDKAHMARVKHANHDARRAARARARVLGARLAEETKASAAPAAKKR